MDLEKRLICNLGCKALDIATFRVTEAEVSQLNKVCIKGPIARGVEGDGVLFSGFPGRERLERPLAECNFGIYGALTPISSVSSRHFGCAFERENWLDSLGKGYPEEGYDLGGISGAPMLLLKESKMGLMSWNLCGVIYNATAQLGEIVLAHHADAIQPDGSLVATGQV